MNDNVKKEVVKKVVYTEIEYKPLPCLTKEGCTRVDCMECSVNYRPGKDYYSNVPTEDDCR